MSRHDDLWSLRQDRWAGLDVAGFEVHAVNRHIGSVIELCTAVVDFPASADGSFGLPAELLALS